MHTMHRRVDVVASVALACLVLPLVMATFPYNDMNLPHTLNKFRDANVLKQVEYHHVAQPLKRARNSDSMGIEELLETGEGSAPNLQHVAIDRVMNGQLIHGHLFILSNPLEHFSVLQPMIGCPGMIKSSVTAQAHQCVVAVNGGFFNFDTGQCLGNIISTGKIVQNAGPRNANFGIRSDGVFVAGYLHPDTVEGAENPFRELVTGVGWLVRNNTKFLDESVDIEQPAFDFVFEKSPRTAIGHDKNGRMLLMQVDGDEAIRSGVDLPELADLMITYGAVNAVNLDGGGSSATYYKGRVISKPSDHCPSGVGRCERPVSSIICIK